MLANYQTMYSIIISANSLVCCFPRKPLYKKQISSHPQKLNNILRNNCEEELTWPYHCYFCLQSFAGGHFPLLDPTIDRSIKYDTQYTTRTLEILDTKALV